MNIARLQRPASRADFEIAVICALTLEADAVGALFDDHWDDDGPLYDKAAGDPNTYSTGAIGRHNVVLAHMPNMGKASAAAVAAHCRVSFPNIKLALIVGICGVVPFRPSNSGETAEIVLGDVIISEEVIQYDLGRRLPEQFVPKDTHWDILGRPNLEIRALLAKLSGVLVRKTLQGKITGYIEVLRGEPELSAVYPGATQDRLFKATYRHVTDGMSCEECGCDGELVPRARLEQGDGQPAVHFGRIASGDTVMKSGKDRDDIARKAGVIAFEMESAGVWDIFPCVVIKGACDYADSHKDKTWQRYAAAAAAACMKAFLGHWTPSMPGAGWQEVRRNRRKPLPPNSLLAPAQPLRTPRSVDSLSTATGRHFSQQSGGERPSTPVRPGTPFVQAMRVSTTYRISNIEITVSEHDIRRLLQDLLVRNAPKPRIRSLAPAAVDRQTVVATFGQCLQLQAALAKLKRSKPPGQLDPRIDDQFQGMTPLSRPWYNPEVSYEAPASKSNVASLVRYLSSWFSSTPASSPLQSVLFDVIFLAPPGEHAFNFWKTETDDFQTEAMWIAEFLPNEGFDRTRISILGIAEGNNLGQECLGLIGKYVQKSQLARPDHTVLLIEFLPGGAPSTRLCAASQVVQRHRQHPKELNARLEAIVFMCADSDHVPGDESLEFYPLPDMSETPEALQFSSNDCENYRAIVDSIWRVLRQSYRPRASLGGSVSALPPEIVNQPLPLLEEFLKPVDRNFINPAPRSDISAIDEKLGLYAITHDEDFCQWLDPFSGLDALQIAAPSDSKLRDLCTLLPSYAQHYEVLHIDCGGLGRECNQEEASGKGNTLIGPFLLKIFEFVVASWAKNLPDGSTMLRTAVGQVLQQIFQESGSEARVSASNTESFILPLVYGLELLGSNLVQILSKALQAPEANSSAIQTTRLMVLLSGFHGFQESPERGRLVHCIRELHEDIKMHCVCKILFAYDGNKHLKGLLSGITCIDSTEMRECLSSLRHMSTTHSKQIDQRHDKTLEWLQQDDKFKAWRDEKTSGLLLLKGKPASGKSVLSRFISETLRAEKDGSGPASADSEGQGRDQAVVASFFFDLDGPDELRAPRTMLQALLYHILSQNHSFFPHFQSQYRRLKKQHATNIWWQEPDLVAVLESLRRHPIPCRVYVVVDGLDESENPSVCATRLSELVSEFITIKLLVAMQPGNAESVLKVSLGKQAVPVREITLQQKNRSDILEYSKSFLNTTVLGHLALKPEGVEKMQGIVADMSQGIFLWAKLVKELVENEFLNSYREASRAELEEFLHAIPQDIKNLYHRLFSRLQERSERNLHDSMPKIRIMFQIVMQAKRPLSLEEFCDVYVCARGPAWAHYGLAESRPLNMADFIANNTANFLEINKETGTVNFLHETASTFVRERLNVDGAGLADATGSRELSVMGSACVGYLQRVSEELEALSAPFSPGNVTAKGVEAFIQKLDNYPFLPYVLEHWSSHVSTTHEGQDNAILRLSKSMAKSPIRFLLSNWMRRLASGAAIPASASSLDHKAFRDGVLHCAAALCLVRCLKIALAAGADIGSKSELHESREDAMCLAIISSRGEPSPKVEEVVRVLLKHGANPNAPTRFGGTPLHYAGKYMQEGVVKLLLSHDADVHYRDAQDMTPLHRTVIGLNKNVSNLDDGDDWEDNARNHGTAVQTGAAPGEYSIPQVRPNGTLARDVSLGCVKLLLDAGSDPRIHDKQGQKPIHWAAALRDRPDIVKALLDAVAREGSRRRRAANEKSSKESTPLQWASGYGNQEVVKLLLDEGAKAGLSALSGKTAINWAARFGHREILENLLNSVRNKPSKELKTIVNQQEKRTGRTALIWACMYGHTECAALLIMFGADVNLAEGGDDDMGGTPLSWAITFGHEEVIWLLLDKGALLDESRGNRSALAWAAASGKVDIFERVLKASREQRLLLSPDEEDSKGQTPFMLAAARGHLDMLRLLRKTYGVRPYAQDNEGNTALLLAAGWGRLEAVKWLVREARLHLDHTNMYGDTALHRAAHWGRQDVIECLLSMGAKGNIENSKGKTYRDLQEDYERRNEE